MVVVGLTIGCAPHRDFQNEKPDAATGGASSADAGSGGADDESEGIAGTAAGGADDDGTPVGPAVFNMSRFDDGSVFAP